MDCMLWCFIHLRQWNHRSSPHSSDDVRTWTAVCVSVCLFACACVCMHVCAFPTSGGHRVTPFLKPSPPPPPSCSPESFSTTTYGTSRLLLFDSYAKKVQKCVLACVCVLEKVKWQVHGSDSKSYSTYCMSKSIERCCYNQEGGVCYRTSWQGTGTSDPNWHGILPSGSTHTYCTTLVPSPHHTIFWCTITGKSVFMFAVKYWDLSGKSTRKIRIASCIWTSI